jgi:hypothetical protein
MLMLMLMLLCLLIEGAQNLNCACVGGAQRLKDLNQIRQMSGPAFLQKLDSPIELRRKPQHVILQSAKIVYGVNSRIGVNIGMLAHNDHSVNALL